MRAFVSRFRTTSRTLGASISKSALSQSRRQQLQPFNDGIVVADEAYAVVQTSDNSAAAGVMDFASETTANEWLRNAAANDPALHGRLHVVPASEKRVAT